MKLSCCLITTNLQSRLTQQQNCVDSINKLDERFHQKIMSVDLFDNGVTLDWFNKYKPAGWQVLSKPVTLKSSMILNQRQAVSHAKSDIILYTEDDILIKYIPKLTTIHQLFNEPLVNGKRTGFICFNNHVWSKFNQNPPHITDFIHDLANYITVDGDVFLVKNDIIRDKYYLNFPVALTPKKLFLELQDYAFVHNVGWAVENAMTNAWFNTGKDKESAVLISLKPEIIDDIKSGKRITVLDFYNYANINFWNNDLSLRHPSIMNRGNTVF